MDDDGVATTRQALRIGHRDRDGGRFGHYHPRLGFSGSSRRGSYWPVRRRYLLLCNDHAEKPLGYRRQLGRIPCPWSRRHAWPIDGGIFCSPSLGLFSGNGFSDGIDGIGGQLGVQLTGIVATFVYTAVTSWMLLRAVNVFVPLRVDQEDETAGLDIVLHDERGYDL